MPFDKGEDRWSSEGSAAGVLSKRGESSLSKRSREWTVGSLVDAFLKEFPESDAEGWDRTGLVVGEAGVPLRKVAFALDPTVSAIREAEAMGANLLITHHPPFISAPDSFAPEKSVALSPGAGVWASIQHGVALACFHTALDVNPRAARVLPGMLGLDFNGVLVEPTNSEGTRGYGQLCDLRDGSSAVTLAQLAARCTAVFGRQPRVWGDFEKKIHTVVTATGSLGSVGRAALAKGVDCVVCGEVKYHEALDLSSAGLAVIELGHDTSELPLAALLAQTALKLGVFEDRVLMIDQTGNWRYPETIRL